MKNCDVQIDGVDLVKEKLQELSKAIGGRTDLLKPTMENVGAAGSDIFVDIIKQQGRRTGGWDDLSPITKILRAKGSRKLYHSIEDAENDDSHKILQDSGLGRQSFLPGSTDNILEVKNVSVIIGSRMKRMKLHNEGGSTTFKFGTKQQSRFKSGFSDKLPGRAPKKTPTGRNSKAKHHWNPEFFKLFNGLKKKDGQSVNVPQRRIQPTIDEITDAEKERLLKIMEAGIEDVMKELKLI